MRACFVAGAGAGAPSPGLRPAPPPQGKDRSHPCSRLVASCSSAVPAGDVGPASVPGVASGVGVPPAVPRTGPSPSLALGPPPRGGFPPPPAGSRPGTASGPRGGHPCPPRGHSTGLPALALWPLGRSGRGSRRRPPSALLRPVGAVFGWPAVLVRPVAARSARRNHRRRPSAAGAGPADAPHTGGVPSPRKMNRRRRPGAAPALGRHSRCGGRGDNPPPPRVSSPPPTPPTPPSPRPLIQPLRKPDATPAGGSGNVVWS